MFFFFITFHLKCGFQRWRKGRKWIWEGNCSKGTSEAFYTFHILSVNTDRVDKENRYITFLVNKGIVYGKHCIWRRPTVQWKIVFSWTSPLNLRKNNILVNTFCLNYVCTKNNVRVYIISYVLTKTYD